MTNEAINEKQKKQRTESNNIYTKRYEKTPKGFLMRLYRNMRSRITGVQKHKAHLYVGKEIMSREDFYAWAFHCSERKFFDMFEDYKESGFDRKLAPTVDRVDSSKGYTVDNIRWLTHSENSRLGAKSYGGFKRTEESKQKQRDSIRHNKQIINGKIH